MESMVTQQAPAGDSRRLRGAALAAALRDSRQRLLARVMDLDDAQWRVPQQAGINPVAWELGHIAWFGEFWTLRGPHHVDDATGFVHAAEPPRIAGPDEVFDSARLAHTLRWRAELPSREQLLERLDAQLQATLAALDRLPQTDAALYFHRLALFHEDMHAEAFAWLRAALGYPAPADCGAGLPRVELLGATGLRGGSAVEIGWPPGRAGFAFDNERDAHPVALRDFEIDAAPVTAGQFLRFVEDDGYGRAAFWPAAAGDWRARSGPAHPQRWRRGAGGDWQMRWFDQWLPLDPAQPLIHVNAWEAEAYCRWAGRRLPTAAEWEHAARASEPGRFLWGGSVWEWTADAFLAYPGFVPGPYKDYSAPWFGEGHRELRGGAFATDPRLHDPRYRNFFAPQRYDVFAGFRTVG